MGFSLSHFDSILYSVPVHDKRATAISDVYNIEVEPMQLNVAIMKS